MPIIKVSSIEYPVYRVKNTKYSKPKGFSLIEVLLSLFFVMALVTILFAASGTLIHTRSVELQGLASRIASKEVERLRNLTFDAFKNETTGTFTDTALSKLPASSANRTISQYESEDLAKIRQVTITISWTEKGVSKTVKTETLIAENGI